MKKILTLAGIMIILSMLSSCLSTLYPLFTEKDIVFDPKLIGSWRGGEKDDDILVFQKGTAKDFSELPPAIQQLADKGYIVCVKNKNKQVTRQYYAFLTRIGNKLYLDFFPATTSRQQQYDAFYKQHFIRMHSFFRIRFNNDHSFDFSQLKEEYLRNLIDNKEFNIKHEVYLDGSYVITAPTEELQQYVLKYGDIPDAYESGTTYTKL